MKPSGPRLSSGARNGIEFTMADTSRVYEPWSAWSKVDDGLITSFPYANAMSFNFTGPVLIFASNARVRSIGKHLLHVHRRKIFRSLNRESYHQQSQSSSSIFAAVVVRIRGQARALRDGSREMEIGLWKLHAGEYRS